MKGRGDNTDDRKRRGQHKRQAQTWTDIDKTGMKQLLPLQHRLQRQMLKSISENSAFYVIVQGLHIRELNV